ncbi:hypothetical protein [Marisediminicola antarctica]|uniref:Uncharacterized protein n=1 Tax=Marisediminicola antarctica TaxID=674079 RepID=A0A7L5AE25_9MICO|nr:hypothetical protein [Marisediminicola antarctica]QHO68503.1 hypothetical protein BHD05_01500 [Marisediminicola antarctica]
MGQFDQFANQGGAAAWDPDETAKAKRVAEEQLKNADYAGDLPEPLSRGAEPVVTDSPADDSASGTADESIDS